MSESVVPFIAETSIVEMEPCQACGGSGEWETECCGGAGGCSCRGRVVPMGACNVCYGSGQVPSDISDERKFANCRAIMGNHFIGSGPRDGSWPNAKTLNAV